MNHFYEHLGLDAEKIKEIEEMKNYIQMQFKNNNRRSEIHRRYLPYSYSPSHWRQNRRGPSIKGKGFLPGE